LCAKFFKFVVIFGMYVRYILFEGLLGFSTGKEPMILWECLLSLRLSVLLIGKMVHTFPKSMSLIKFSSAVMWESE